MVRPVVFHREEVEVQRHGQRLVILAHHRCPAKLISGYCLHGPLYEGLSEEIRKQLVSSEAGGVTGRHKHAAYPGALHLNFI